MSLVSQGAFSLSSFPSVPGRRPRWSTAIPEGSSGPDPAQGHKMHAVASRGSGVMAPGSVPWHGLSSSAVHTPGFTPGLPLLHPGGCFAALEHLPRHSWLGCSPWSSHGCLKDGSQFTELLCSLAHPGKDPSSFIPIFQPGFSSLTPSRGHISVGKLRHRVAA